MNEYRKLEHRKGEIKVTEKMREEARRDPRQKSFFGPEHEKELQGKKPSAR